MSDNNHRLAGAEPAEQPQDAGDISETFMDKDTQTETRHTISESADKIRLDTKVKRGSGTRDQDEVKVSIKGNDPDETAERLAATLAALEEHGVATTLRETQPGDKQGPATCTSTEPSCVPLRLAL